VPTDSEPRGAAIADLVRNFEGHLIDHRGCAGLDGSIVELTANGARWGVAWLRCPTCGMRWERRLALNGTVSP
jgi:cation transport regulator ChaC